MARRSTSEPDHNTPLALGDVYNTVLALDALDAHSENPNRHPDDQIDALVQSLEAFGQAQSITVWRRPGGRYTIVGGHGLVTAARHAGLAEIKADVLPEHMTPASIRAIMIALNEHARHSVLDETRFADLLESSRLAGYDLHALGSSAEDLDALKARLADAFLSRGSDPDEADAQDNPDDAGWGGDDEEGPDGASRPKRDQDWRDGPLDDEDAAGTQLAKLTLALYQPRHTVARGDIFWLSAPDCPRQHVLLCVDPHRDWPLWQPYLPRLVAEGVGETRARQVIYAQFPDPLLPLSRRARHLRMVLVQPDRHLAGHLLDKVAEVWGEAALAREYAVSTRGGEGAPEPAATADYQQHPPLRLVRA